MLGKIIGLGSYLPSKVLTNKDLEEMVETSDEWIVERTGIRERHISDPYTESVSQMSVNAAKAAIEDAGIDPAEIDIIILASTTSNMIVPSSSCVVQREIGAKNAACFDLNSACTGFLTAYNTAQSFIEAGHIKTALVIGSECTSNYVDWTDRGTCILFGDAAGAAVLRAEESEKGNMFVLHADGSKGDCLYAENMKQRKDAEELLPKTFFLMDGKEVFKFAVTAVPSIIKELCDKYSINKDEIDLFVLHQANSRIIEGVSKRLGVPLEKFPMNIDRMGNTSSASIPSLLTELKKAGQLKPGTKIIASGFGAGLTWGASYIEF